MKKLLTILTILFAGIVMIACEEENLHDQVFSSVSIMYAEGDSSVSVTKNITLPITSSVSGAQLTWVSGNPSIIDTFGNVTRPTTTTVVIMVLQVTIDGTMKDKPFMLNVIGTNSDGGNNDLTVSFNSNGGSVVADQSVAVGGKVTAPTNPTRSGFTFAGWYKDVNLEIPWDFETDVVNQNTTLYAKWLSGNNNFIISFNSDGGSAVANQSVAAGGKITPPANPTKSGFSFAGWYKDTNLEIPWNFGTDVVNQNTTLYAKWSIAGGQIPAGYIGIGTVEEFMAIEDFSKKYILTADIDFQGAEAKPLGAWGSVDWTGEKNPGGIFKGEFDGNGYALMNFKITGSEHPGLIENGLSYGTSLFPNLTGKVRNLNIINATIVGDGFSGGVAGLVEGGSISNVYFQGTVISLKSWGSVENMAVPAGGIAGMLGGGTTSVSNVFVDAVVTGGHVFFGYSFAQASNLLAVEETLGVEIPPLTGQEKEADTPYLVKTFVNAEVVKKAQLSTISFGIKWSTVGATRPYLIRVDGSVPSWALV